MDTSRYRARNLQDAALAAGSAFGTATEEREGPVRRRWRSVLGSLFGIGITATLLAYLLR